MKTELKNEIKALINDQTLAEPEYHHCVMSEKTVRTMLTDLGVLPGKIDGAVEAFMSVPSSGDVEWEEKSEEELRKELDQLLKKLGWK